jgi:carbon-monoxide dehydrogenase medium subunit
MDGAIRVPVFEQALARSFDASALRGLALDEALMPSDVHAGADYRAHMAQVLCRRAVARINQGAAS